MIVQLGLLWALWGQSPVVEISTLSGATHTGQLVSLSASEAALQTENDVVKIPVQDLMQLSPTGAPSGGDAADGPSRNTGTILIDLHDQSQLRVAELASVNGQFRALHPVLQELTIPRAQVRSVRLAPAAAEVDAAWSELQQRSKRRDYLVIRKGDVLDHLDGVIGELDDTKLKFLLDGDQIEVGRGRIFGWIYAADPPARAAAGVRVDLGRGEVVLADAVTWQDNAWQIKLAGARQPVAVPPARVQALDFSAGKVLYLSAVEPRDVEHVPYFGEGAEWPYQRDRNLFGRPLKVGSRTYRRGLAIHSKTRLIYRLGGDYRRLTTVAGIDPDLPRSTEPGINNARLTIKGDGRVLFDADVRAGDSPVPLDLQVAGVRELEILVDYGEGHLDIGDRVHLGDLKVLK